MIAYIKQFLDKNIEVPEFGWGQWRPDSERRLD